MSWRKADDFSFETNDQYTQNEIEEQKKQREIFAKFINFQVYEQFFRSFCKNKYTEHSF